MKFGRSLHQRVVPAWADSYIDYDRLKTLLSGGAAAAEFSAALRHEISLVDGFCSQQKAFTRTRLDAVAKRYSIKIGSTEACVFEHVSKAELNDLVTSLVEVCDFLTQLEWYWHVNYQGINILMDKAVATYGAATFQRENLEAKSSEAPSPCRSLLSSINGTLEVIHHALNSKVEQRRQSLLLDRFVDVHSRSAVTDIVLAVHEDDDAVIEQFIHTPSPDIWVFLRAFLHIAIVHHSVKCQQLLLAAFATHVKPPISKKYDYLHRIARRMKGHDDEKAGLEFRDVLDALAPREALFLEGRDRRGRLPIHYAAELGLEAVCREIWTRSKFWKKIVIESTDATGATAFDLAVRSGRSEVVTSILEHVQQSDSLDKKMAVSPLLSVAILSGFEDIAQTLISRDWGTKFVMKDGRAMIHLATQKNLKSIVASLCQESQANLQEPIRGRTSLMLAAIEEHDDIVQTLLDNGADTSVLDLGSWTAKDHAAYRGYIQISASLGLAKTMPLSSKSHARRATRNILPAQIPSGTSFIFVTPGTADLFNPVPFVDLSPLAQKHSPRKIPETSLWLSISAMGCSGESFNLRLPDLEDRSDFPWIFQTTEPEKVKLVFKLHSQFQRGPIGTAVGLLDRLKGGFAQDRESLVRDFTLPFVDTDGDFIGQLTFTFLVAQSSTGRLPCAYNQQLEMPKFTEVGGHRGNGWNDGTHDYLQIGENTIQSFQTAAELGASIVEFDVQLTKDHVPIVYHDFLVSEAGFDAAMHYLTYDQFMALSDAQSCVEHTRHSSRRLPWDERARPREQTHRRSRSICAPDDRATDALLVRMKKTHGYPGWKANLRNENIYEPFITLKELYQNLSEDVPLSIEIKYPMLSEARDFLLDPFAPELNMVIDTILDITAQYAGPRRRITLSSFSPEICMAVAVKQSTYPILFLNDSCNNPTGDFRATSVQTAARLAHRFGMAGVGMAGEPFVDAPGLIAQVKGQGLYTMSYGAVNDEVQNAKTQARLGLDLLIVNKVKLIKQELDAMQQASASV